MAGTVHTTGEDGDRAAIRAALGLELPVGEEASDDPQESEGPPSAAPHPAERANQEGTKA